MPLAGGFLSGPEAIAGEQTYPLVIHVCGRCGLVQITDPIDPDILFQDYSFASSTVGPLVQHFEAYAKWLSERFAPRTVVEFGCNDGILLRPLQRLGVRAVGVDLSRNITEMARSEGLEVETGAFDPDMAGVLRKRLGPVDLITGSNAFAHNERPELILEAAKRLLAEEGHLCLEVMYARDLLELLQWDTLYHEHLTFYSLGTLSNLLKRYGFHVVHAERIPMHGGSLRVAASLAERPASPEAAAILADEDKLALNRAETWRAFGGGIARKIDVVAKTLERLCRTSRIWGYGAAGKATLWVNACRLTALEAVVDASPLRAGKLMPGTHTPIVFPQELRKNPPDYIFVTAWNYASVICRNESWFQGIWVTPLPELRMF
jgi:novobiocin biosynthesis protein NovU/D-mycarose 3-C-methyltransferase